MKNKGNVLRNTILLLLLVFLISMFNSNCVYASEHDPVHVKVGYTEFSVSKIKDGELYGYQFEYLDELSKYGNFEYEYIKGECSDLLDQLETGEIDLMFSVDRTPEREKLYDFSTLTDVNYVGFFFSSMNSSLNFEDYENFSDLKVGYIRDCVIIDSFQAYAKKHGFSVELYPYDSHVKMQKALESGEIDSCIKKATRIGQDNKLIGEFIVEPSYLAGTKGGEILPLIDSAMRILAWENPTFKGTLIEKYFRNMNVSLTADEKELIKENKNYTVGIIPNRNIMSHYNEETGELSGITVETVNLIVRESGLNLTFIKLDADKSMEQSLLDGDCDLIVGVPYQEGVENEKPIVVSQTYMEDHQVLVKRKDMNYKRVSYTISVPNQFIAMYDFLEENYANWEIIDTQRENRLDTILSGDSDLSVGNEYEMYYMLQMPKYEDLEMVYEPFYKMDLVFEAKSEIDPLLISILNKSIQVNKMELQELYNGSRYSMSYQWTMKDYIRENWIIIVLSLSLLIVLLLIVFYQKRNNRIIKLQSIEMEKANQAKTNFLSVMSHEIRTPLNAMIGLNGLVEDSLDNPKKAREYLKKSEESSAILLSIINDILDMSAIENDKIKIANDPFDIKETIFTVTNIYYQQAKERNQTFHVRGMHLFTEILIGDSYRLRQILINILSNAVKFTPEGGTIDFDILQVQQNIESKVDLIFHVSDNGCGMSENLKKRLFQKFEQGNSTTVRKHGGSGLGLSITKHLTELLGGTIEVVSQEGVGSGFIVKIPFEILKKQEEIFPIQKKMKALILDEDLETAQYISEIMDHMGIENAYFNDPMEADQDLKKDISKNCEYNLFIFDVKYMKNWGKKLVYRIKKNKQTMDSEFLITGYDEEEFSESAELRYKNSFLLKPVFLSTLSHAIIDLLNKNQKNEKEKNQIENPYMLQGMHILLCEDNEINRMIVIKILEKVGIIVHIAEDGEIGYSTFKNFPKGTFHAILMDIQMPEMDGYEATALIRNEVALGGDQIPIYAMTANAFAKDVEKSMKVGMNGHLAKPFTREELYQILREVRTKDIH